MRQIIFLIVVALFLYGCADKKKYELEKEIVDLKQKVAQQEEEIDLLHRQRSEIQKLKQKFAEFKKKSEQYGKITDPVLSRLQELDKQLYNGKFIAQLRKQSPKPSPEEFRQAYIDLIDYMSSGLKD